MTLKRIQIFFVILFGIALLSLGAGEPVHAVSASDWKAGNIINDSLFYDNSSMSVEAIQGFLNSRVNNCDTNGSQSAADLGYPNMTHAQYAAMRGWPGPPYICLKDYMQVPDSSQVISNFQGSTPAGAISAAQIIKNAADTYHISPKALIVTLQKESLNLLYDNWPMLSQYKNSMGYGCPDTAPCDPKYEGFYNQMMNAAWQFNAYRTNSASYRYKPFMANDIYYNPTASCGASSVYIENYATSGLYNYTPYQPNQAALNNLYGSGDGCSAYGNRNFWRIFNDWFGSGFIENNQLYVVSPMSSSHPTLVKGEQITLSYTVQNKSNANMDTGVLWICTSINGKAYGSGSVRKVLAPSETLTVSMPYTPQETGTLTAKACGATPNSGGYVEGYPNEVQYGYREHAFTVNSTGMTISTAISANAPLYKGVPTTLSYTVQNRGQNSADTGTLWICTALNGRPFGTASTGKVLTPNETLTVSVPYTPQSTGTLELTACGNPPNGPGWVSGYPNRDYYDHGYRAYTVSTNPIAIVAAIATTAPPLAGVPNNLTYTVQNRGAQNVDSGVLWICTALNGKPYGSGAVRKILAPNETLTVTMPYTPQTTGTLELTACGNTPDGPGWVSDYPTRDYYDHGYRVFKVYKNPITISLAVSTSNPPRVGIPTTLSYNVQNRSSQTVDTGVLWICTSLNGKPYGSGSVRKVLAPNEVLTVSMPYTPSEVGTLEVTACGNTPDGPGWVSDYPTRDYYDHGYRVFKVSY